MKPKRKSERRKRIEKNFDEYREVRSALDEHDRLDNEFRERIKGSIIPYSEYVSVKPRKISKV